MMESRNPPRARSSRDPKRWWLPIRKLGPRHRPRILVHLLALNERDRYLRFGQAATDTQIRRYVESLNFDGDEIFGVFDLRFGLVAMAHLAYPGAASAHPECAEFGISVGRPQRGRGVGERMFDHAALHARNRGIETLLVNALSENSSMLRITRKAGARIVREGPESCAWVRLAPPNLASRVEELVGDHAAEFLYGVERQVYQVADLLPHKA
jgi:GNAT superfamily N-acetyltransferase